MANAFKFTEKGQITVFVTYCPLKVSSEPRNMSILSGRCSGSPGLIKKNSSMIKKTNLNPFSRSKTLNTFLDEHNTNSMVDSSINAEADPISHMMKMKKEKSLPAPSSTNCNDINLNSLGYLLTVL